jgi:cytidylate kinase
VGSNNKINIALDGYSACGKSTLAQALARVLQYDYIDSGAMYRAVTLYAIRNGINETNLVHLLPLLPDIKIECIWSTQGNMILLNGEDVTQQIRSQGVQNLVSQVSTLPEVRQFLVSQQKEMAKKGGVVMDGRDIGSKVLPGAQLKIFMTADPEVRVARRLHELLVKGIDTNEEEIRHNLKFRDHTDSTRLDSPLLQTPDAKVLDNTDLTPDDQLKVVLKWVDETINA